MWLSRRAAQRRPVADICLVVEGCYPYVPGGVSSWIDWLIKGNPGLSFAVVAVVADGQKRDRRFTLPDNVVAFTDLPLATNFNKTLWREFDTPDHVEPALANALHALVTDGALEEFQTLVNLIRNPRNGLSPARLMASPLSWRVTCEMYRLLMPHASFLHFFWAWRALFGGLFSILSFELPKARAYHTISTGYAGLLAARAAVETGAPAIITEHGIYTNERRIEILMAEWICDTVEKGINLRDERIDLRDIWMKIFEAYASICYQACAKIITLYEDNQTLQRALNAPDDRLSVIANGIDLARFAGIAPPAPDTPPTVALIGRVVPIKDVKSFIEAIAIARRSVPSLRALILGPTEEDQGYFEECQRSVRDLALQEVVVFTGGVNIVDYLSTIHVVVLTSLSEAQPLVLLEAGAAGIPCVATDVGSCREIIEGRSNEMPRLGPGGQVVGLVAPNETAAAICRLLTDEDERRIRGEALRRRVQTYYASEDAIGAYRAVYAELLATAPSRRGE